MLRTSWGISQGSEVGGELVVALERAFAEAAAGDGFLVGGGIEIGLESEARAAAGQRFEHDDAEEARRRVVTERGRLDLAVAVNDAIGRRDLDELAVRRVVAAVGAAHHVIPAAPL